MADERPDLTGRVNGMPFAVDLGLRDVRGDEHGIDAFADWAAEHCTGGDTLHGGYLMAVADTLGAMASGPHLPAGAGTTTLESKTNFMSGVRSGTIRIHSEPIHVGRTTIVVVTDIHRDDGKLVSRTTQTQAVLLPR
jgi:1,4-dihydroxy-2-naphthoyl-CoA hydrolase